jgi:quaternary ammonium compound-resistance protein SugE
MAWVYLLAGGACEVIFTACLKYAASFTRLLPTAGFLAAAAASFAFLNLSIRTIPLGTAYAVWTGIGAVGTAIWGITMFAEPVNVLRLVFLALIIAGIFGLKLVSPN